VFVYLKEYVRNFDSNRAEWAWRRSAQESSVLCLSLGFRGKIPGIFVCLENEKDERMRSVRM
jgi:hypothetical protein